MKPRRINFYEDSHLEIRLENQRSENLNTYYAYLELTEDSWGGRFPDLSGCISAGESTESTQQIISSLQEALALHIDGMKEDGDPIPLPRTYEKIPDDCVSLLAIPYIPNFIAPES